MKFIEVVKIYQKFRSKSEENFRKLHFTSRHTIEFNSPKAFVENSDHIEFRLISTHAHSSFPQKRNYSVKLLLLLFKPFKLLLILFAVELLWLAFELIGLGFTTFCETLVGVLRCLMRCCSVVSKPLRTSWLGIFLANNRRFTESSYVNSATMFWRRKPWQYSISFDALYTFAFGEKRRMWQMEL